MGRGDSKTEGLLVGGSTSGKRALGPGRDMAGPEDHQPAEGALELEDLIPGTDQQEVPQG